MPLTTTRAPINTYASSVLVTDHWTVQDHIDNAYRIIIGEAMKAGVGWEVILALRNGEPIPPIDPAPPSESARPSQNP